MAFNPKTDSIFDLKNMSLPIRFFENELNILKTPMTFYEGQATRGEMWTRIGEIPQFERGVILAFIIENLYWTAFNRPSKFPRHLIQWNRGKGPFTMHWEVPFHSDPMMHDAMYRNFIKQEKTHNAPDGKQVAREGFDVLVQSMDEWTKSNSDEDFYSRWMREQLTGISGG